MVACQSDVRSCIIPGLPKHLMQELNVRNVGDDLTPCSSLLFDVSTCFRCIIYFCKCVLCPLGTVNKVHTYIQ